MPSTELRQQSRWMSGLDPQLPASDAAAKIVELRLARLIEVIPLVRDLADEDPEHIHQLRVASRRADAALEAFRPCFKPKRWKKMESRVRKIRRAAGQVRTCDVHLADLAAHRKSQTKDLLPSLEHAIELTLQERLTAQQRVIEVVDRHHPKKLARRVEKLLKSVGHPDAERFHALAAERLGKDADATRPVTVGRAGKPLALCDVAQIELPLLVQLVADAATRDLSVFENLHELRLEAKQLRYAIELFTACCAEELTKTVYPQVKAMQDRLGRINDCHELALRTGRYARERSDAADDSIGRGLQRLSILYRSERDDGRAEFIEWWESGPGAAMLRALAKIEWEGESGCTIEVGANGRGTIRNA